MDLVTRVAALSDLVAVDVCQRLAADLLRRPGPSLEEAAAALPPALPTMPTFAGCSLILTSRITLNFRLACRCGLREKFLPMQQ